jgi:folate-dependent phosphoribosylglycinamide formyltransferase PurN
MKNIVILISGGGSNMATIVRTAQQEQWEQRYGARVAAVVSNKADAKGWFLPARRALPPQCWTTRRLPAARRLMRAGGHD